MRSNRPTTSQTVYDADDIGQTICDADDCTAYSITAFYRPSSPGDQSAIHNAALTAEGWTDREGRDYCPDCNPAPVTTQPDPKEPHVTTRTRTHTPDRENPDGSTTIHLKRACNGCGLKLGDLADWDADTRGNLTDVRGECAHCRPLVEAEAAGCRTWQLTGRNVGVVADQIDRIRPWVFTKGYWQEVDGKLQVVGLRIGEYPDHVVAYFGDWIIRRPDGTWAVHPAPKETQR